MEYLQMATTLIFVVSASCFGTDMSYGLLDIFLLKFTVPK